MAPLLGWKRQLSGCRFGFLALLCGLFISGCAGDAPPPAAGPSFRDQSQPIASKALWDPARFAGKWNIFAAYPGDDLCSAGALTLQIREGAVVETLRCADRPDRVLTGALSGPGRYRVAGRDRWVLWADEAYRTAVIGTPDGSMAWILERSLQLPADRGEAARELLDFNGYDVSRLQEVSR